MRVVPLVVAKHAVAVIRLEEVGIWKGASNTAFCSGWGLQMVAMVAMVAMIVMVMMVVV
jgi:hypothetical protein